MSPEEGKRWKFKFETLRDHCVNLEDTIAKLQVKLHHHQYYSNNEYWGWQAYGDNYIESLVCPVLISADDLRGVLKQEYRQGRTDIIKELKAIGNREKIPNEI